MLSLSACASGTTETNGSPSVAAEQSAPGAADHIVNAEAALTLDYEAPTFAEFARQPLTSNVISGTVTATRTVVTPPANIVETVLTVSVGRQRNPKGATTVEVREPGGIVTVEQVRSDFEDKLGRELTEEELAETADYRFNGVEHAKVGDRVLIVVADDPATDEKNSYTSRARLVPAGPAGSKKFTWPGKAMNPKWEDTVDVDSVM
ncbi:hypothetical protein [Streptomyces flavalbus]|uniref:Lipoprotein n=1 Tax=Streptomyces flavalbus TaxID=2665155 RepID=A0ABW2WF28_9ACTN